MRSQVCSISLFLFFISSVCTDNPFKDVYESESLPESKDIISPSPLLPELILENDRIIGGIPTEPHEYPFIVSIQILKGFPTHHQQYCDGTILNEAWILTAGHCSDLAPAKYSILAGAHDQSNFNGTEQRVNVLRIIRHRKFNRNTIDYDIGLMKIYPSFIFVKNVVQPVQLPTSESIEEGNGVVVGWGTTTNNKAMTTTPKILQKISIPIIDQKNCTNIYIEINPITPRMFCAGYEKNKNTCHGDSGGPLLCLNKQNGIKFQCGIVSWGVGCASEGFPGVFTRVFYFNEWISCKINSQDFCDEFII